MRRLTLIVTVCLLVTACGELAERKLDVGQFVKSKLSGQKGMVVGVYCMVNGSPCTYNIRFLMDKMTTRTHILGKDDSIIFSPFSIVRMAYYELEEYRKEK